MLWARIILQKIGLLEVFINNVSQIKYNQSKASPLAIKDNPYTKNDNPLTCYPNPARDVVYAKIKLTQSENVKYQLVDLNGSILQQFDYTVASGEQIFAIRTESFKPGIYLFKLETSTQVYVEKVIVN